MKYPSLIPTRSDDSINDSAENKQENLEKEEKQEVIDFHLKDFWDVLDLSQHLGVRPSTVYRLVEEQGIPFYRIGHRLIRFKPAEIHEWMKGNKRDRIDPEKAARKALGSVKRGKLDLNRITRKAIAEVKGEGYNASHGKTRPSQRPQKGGRQ